MSMRLATVALLFCGVISAQDSTSSPAAVFANCQSCHGMPQVDIPGDDLWIDRVATTACVTPAGDKSAGKRRALMAWLRAEERQRPRVERRPRPRAEGEGVVTANIAQGSLLLGPAGGVGDGSVMIRLVWNGEKGSGAMRAVPVGDWEVRGYRVQRVADDGTAWQIWGSGRRGQKLTVRPGEATEVVLDQQVHVKSRATLRRGQLSVGVSVSGDSRMGLSVIRRGDRVPASYALVCGDGVTAGGLSYG